MTDTRRALATMDARKDKFAEAYAANAASIAPACQVAGVSRSTYKRWRREDPDFDSRLCEAYEAAVDEAEAEVRRRGVHGVEEPVVHKGALMYRLNPDGTTMLDDDLEPIPFTVNRRSDRMLELYVRANREGYRDRKEATVRFEGGVEVRKVLDLEGVPTGQLLAVMSLLEGAVGERPDVVDADYEELPTPVGGIDGEEWLS